MYAHGFCNKGIIIARETTAKSFQGFKFKKCEIVQINVIRQLNRENKSLSMIFIFILIILMFSQVFMGKSALYLQLWVSFEFSILNSQIFITVLYYTVGSTHKFAQK